MSGIKKVTSECFATWSANVSAGARNMASLVQRGNHYCVVYQYTNENGERKQKWETYKTASEAKRRKKEIEYKEEVGTFTVPKCKSLDDLLKEYVALYGKAT